LNISELLHKWFKSFDKEYLFDVVKDALTDERLLLVIDGIDEWNSLSSAQQAIDRVEITANLNNTHIIYSSRLYGFRLLKDSFKDVNVLNLALFSQKQQREFIEKWYSKWAESIKTKDKEFSKKEADSFVNELNQTNDLKKLAENPLLLSILIVQKMRYSTLPKNKLNALQEITQYLIDKHPLKRKKDANLNDNSISDINFKDIFCELAMQIQKESNDGVILKQDAHKVIENYLVQYAAYDVSKAKLRSKEFVDIGANHFGIIIEKSNDEIAFTHKQFQEFLAAQYLSESDVDVANKIINDYGANPAFHQVITNFFGLIPTKKVKEYSNYLTKLKEAKHTSFQENYLNLIVYEITINSDNTPSDIATNNLKQIIRDFEYATDMNLKTALLKLILNALSNSRFKNEVEDFLLGYFPNQNKYSDYRVQSLRDAENLTNSQISFLEKSLINGTTEIKLDASYALRKHIKNESVFNFISSLLETCSNPDIVAYAINSLITEDIEIEVSDNLIKNLKIEHTLVKFFLQKYKVFAKRNTDDDIEEIISITNGFI